jgi:hypothetical protein
VTRRRTNRCTRAAGACFLRCFISSTWPLSRGRVNSTVMRLILFITMIVSLGLFSAQPNLAIAQKLPYGVFQGRIIEANGNIIRGASVTVESPSYTRVVKPNPAGHFGIELPVGVYKIIVKKPGFATYQLTDFVIKAGGYASHVFRLEPSNRQSAIPTTHSYQSATHNNCWTGVRIASFST